MAIIVHMAFIENKGVDEGTNHWKFADSQTYRVLGTDKRPANAVALVIQYTNSEYAMHYGFQYPTGWERISDNAGVWESLGVSMEEEFDHNPPITLRYQRKQAVCVRCKKGIKGLIDWLRTANPLPVHPTDGNINSGCAEESMIARGFPICADCGQVIKGYVKMIMTDPPIPVCISCTPDRTFTPKPKAGRIN
jgi:hypothetical protein